MSVAARSRSRALSGIMPLLDVLFILLFSLLALSEAKSALHEEEEVRIELPGVEAGGSAAEPDGPRFALEVDAAGVVRLAESGEVVGDRAALEAALAHLIGDALPEEVSVEIQADRNAPHGVAVELLQYLRLRGISRVQLLATGYAQGGEIFGAAEAGR